jgi:hypothetical protein
VALLEVTVAVETLVTGVEYAWPLTAPIVQLLLPSYSWIVSVPFIGAP